MKASTGEKHLRRGPRARRHWRAYFCLHFLLLRLPPSLKSTGFSFSASSVSICSGLWMSASRFLVDEFRACLCFFGFMFLGLHSSRVGLFFHRFSHFIVHPPHLIVPSKAHTLRPITLSVESYPGDLDEDFCCKLIRGCRKSLTTKLDESTCPWICKTIIHIQASPRVSEWAAMGGEISAMFQHIGAQSQFPGYDPSPNFLDSIRFDSIRLHFRLPNYLQFIFSGNDGGSILDHALDFLTRGVCWPCCCLCTVEQLKARRLKHDNVTGSLLRLLHSSLRVSQVTCPATTQFQNHWPLKQDTLCVVILLLLL